LGDVDGGVRTAAQEPGPGTAAAYEEFGHQPVAGALLFDGDVLDGDHAGAVPQVDLPVQQLSEDESLPGALGEAADVHQPVGDHRTGVDPGHPGQRQEHPAFTGDLD